MTLPVCDSQLGKGVDDFAKTPVDFYINDTIFKALKTLFCFYFIQTYNDLLRRNKLLLLSFTFILTQLTLDQLC